MTLRLEDYALVGDTETAALVGIDGSMDWLCLPRFDSPACLAALLGTPEHGRWLLAPAGGVRRTRRRYRGDTLVLETEMETEDGVVRLVDFMPPRDGLPDVVRLVLGVSGRVPMRFELAARFDYGRLRPRVLGRRGPVEVMAGPDALSVYSPVDLTQADGSLSADFAVAAGDRLGFRLAWHPSHRPPRGHHDPFDAMARTEEFWRSWSAQGSLAHEWREATRRSLLTLKALTHGPTGGIVAAPTTSLPEAIGGSRNWDYRYCWLRDATMTLHALLSAGYGKEAEAWREWLLRAAAGDPWELQTMYGVDGESRLTEIELPWLPGYEGSSPVRTGNAAYTQLQLDVVGELFNMLHLSVSERVPPGEEAWELARAVLDHLESNWKQPDDGIWEVRGPRRHFVHSKVMAWVAFDRAVRLARRLDSDAPVERWQAVRDAIHREVCERGYDAERQTFVQAYGSPALDAAVLQIPLTGFLRPTDPRVLSTARAIERELVHDGFVYRYDPEDGSGVDGLPAGEGAFLPCTFWLADALALAGHREEALSYFERVLAVRNDVGLLAEEYDPARQRLVGNFPQAFSHVYLVHSVACLTGTEPGERSLPSTQGLGR